MKVTKYQGEVRKFPEYFSFLQEVYSCWMWIFCWDGQKKAYWASSSHCCISEGGALTTFVPFQLVASLLALGLGLKMRCKPKSLFQPFQGLCWVGCCSVESWLSWGHCFQDCWEVLSGSSFIYCLRCLLLIILPLLWVILNKLNSMTYLHIFEKRLLLSRLNSFPSGDICHGCEASFPFLNASSTVCYSEINFKYSLINMGQISPVTSTILLMNSVSYFPLRPSKLLPHIGLFQLKICIL